MGQGHGGLESGGFRHGTAALVGRLLHGQAGNAEAALAAAAALVAAVITAVVIPYIKSRTTAQQQAEINAWVKIAVTAAEQIYRGSGRGEEKKAYVLNWLAEHGITLDEDRIDALIEAAVYELNHGVLKEGAGNE